MRERERERKIFLHLISPHTCVLPKLTLLKKWMKVAISDVTFQEFICVSETQEKYQVVQDVTSQERGSTIRAMCILEITKVFYQKAEVNNNNAFSERGMKRTNFKSNSIA